MSDHTVALPELQPEPEGRSRKGLVAVVATVVAVVLIVVGGFAAWQFFLAGGGARPAEVLPASTFALASVDLDPSSGQKVEAIRTLRKFPSFRENTGLRPDSDVIKEIFDEALADGPCKSLDYERDIKSWIGQRAGVGGVVLSGNKPTPVLTLQVKDAENAKAGFTKLAKCADAGDDFGWTLTDDYVIASDSTEHAKAIVAAGTKAPLSEDGAYQRWTEAAGGDGIVNIYVAKKAADVAGDALKSFLEGMGGTALVPGLSGGDVQGEFEKQFAEEFPEGMPTDLPTGLPSDLASPGTRGRPAPALGGAVTAPAADDDLQKRIDKTLESFEGAAAVLKFADGGIELSMATNRAKGAKPETVADHVGALPKDTAAVMAGAVPASIAEELKTAGETAGEGPFSLDGLFSGVGLDFPDDLVTLLGDSLSFSLGGKAPTDSDISGPEDLPVGLLVHGDQAEIEKVIAKVEASTGQKLSDLPASLASDEGKVALATTSTYADELVANGSLGDSTTYKDTVPHADDAVAVAYVALSDDWMDVLKDLAKSDKDAAELVDNLAAARALGASVWTEGDVAHGLLRLSVR